MTTSGSYDFTGYQVLVVGGARGEGHAIASDFASSGASVTVTGTMMLRSLYDTDLSAFDYESVNLARQDSIDHLAASITHIDVLVLAAPCALPHGLPPDEQAFIAQAVRSGLLGPTFLTTRLRLKLGQSPALGGGCVVHTGAVTSWLQLSGTPEAARRDLVETTARAGHNWAGLGVRVNAVLPMSPSVLPRQYAPGPASGGGSRTAGGTLVRARSPQVADAVADATLFLASSAAARITGQTLLIS
ncbi:SDR family oxidoreductase [Nocardioides sp. zg-1228]|uniref:SDR family oxidoreductase n=1 Tax=Nocardioides sp. zg-1228 TaxID=2763008 RepID=UPI00164271B7|nr:SDR family oxidoreductase [Nocardioides sp. zg-1228]MBC2934112.1 SDR family oxidoreductase [Nocardioides sp. zg-1228]QSF58860.1 SDR family oxidoreductase [Nocardioides sp. zg-1228]